LAVVFSDVLGLAHRARRPHHSRMAKDEMAMVGGGDKAKRRATPVLGVTRDGVRILKQPGGATHFTAKELHDAIRLVREAKTAG
jgi:hypothetical protein